MVKQKISEGTKLGTTFMALALTMLTISFNAFNAAGVNWLKDTLFLLGIVATFFMVVFFIVGIWAFKTKRLK